MNKQFCGKTVQRTLQLVLYVFVIHLIVDSNCFQCGQTKVKINEAIVRGYDAIKGSFPWHVALYHRKNRDDSYVCGGTLIGPTFVLTVEHCVKDENDHVLTPYAIFVKVGVYNLYLPSSKTVQHQVFKIHRFTQSDKELQRRNDIALLELKTEAVFNPYVQPACINQEENIVGAKGMTVGWGFTEDGNTPEILKAAQMSVISTITCLEYDRDTFGSTLDNSTFCAGNINGTTVCLGDSGGGLHIQRGDVWYVAGIVSFGGSNICRNGYAAFTNVANFVPWIGNVTGLIPSEGKYSIRRSNATHPSKQKAFYLPRNCGNFLYYRISGGSPAKLFQFPWMALLANRLPYKNNTFHFTCGGSLISKRYVLSAAQCVHSSKPSIIRLGEFDLTQTKDCDLNDPMDCAPPVQDIEIQEVIIHEKFSAMLTRHDIALIRLIREVSFDDHIHPICLPVAHDLRNLRLPNYFITGFGLTASDEYFDRLMKATVQQTALEECQKEFSRPKLTEAHICTGAPEDQRSSCAGDAGGPLGYPVRHYGVRFVQFAIISFGSTKCGTGPVVYSNVSYFMDWILANLEA